jgi:hypothetical protein
MERSIDWVNVQIKARRIRNVLVIEVSTVIVDSNDTEPKVVKIVDAQSYAHEVLSFITSQVS